MKVNACKAAVLRKAIISENELVHQCLLSDYVLQDTNSFLRMRNSTYDT